MITLSNEIERELVRLLGLNLTDYRALTMLASAGPTTVSALAGGAVLGALGYAGMGLAVFADVGVALLAILNAMRAMK